uniref:Uncharacterized protein n=1 Tax=Glossina austeni TaxID=7395 RepID=A0A1A9UTA5_GLOAU
MFRVIYARTHVCMYIVWSLYSLGILLNRQSPPESTPLESCRVAPYVNLATVRSASGASQDNNINTSATTTTGETGGKRANNVFNAHPYLGVVSGNGTISAFDPAIISAAAHQVRS